MSSAAGLAVIQPINITDFASDVNPFHKVFGVSNAHGYSILEFSVLTDYSDPLNNAKIRVNNRQVGAIEPSPTFFMPYTIIFANSALRPGAAPYNGNQDLYIIPTPGTLLQIRNMRILYQRL
ncbi:hypothetical protein ABZ419_11560 [Streptomyces cinnamoneus]|uniref:hypothetical protein n=1 Tax=Streptomyces cinnamoneus TaxID=53446 RepID=UPI0033ED212C